MVRATVGPSPLARKNQSRGRGVSLGPRLRFHSPLIKLAGGFPASSFGRRRLTRSPQTVRAQVFKSELIPLSFLVNSCGGPRNLLRSRTSDLERSQHNHRRPVADRPFTVRYAVSGRPASELSGTSREGGRLIRPIWLVDVPQQRLTSGHLADLAHRAILSTSMTVAAQGGVLTRPACHRSDTGL